MSDICKTMQRQLPVMCLALTSFLMGNIGCGATKEPPKRVDQIVRANQQPEMLLDAKTMQEISFDNFRSDLMTTEVIYIGEMHENALHHGMQFTILRALHKQVGSMEIGMEMFQTSFQKDVDDWVDGRLDEMALRRQTEYDRRWGYDIRLYRPILEHARAEGIRILALSPPSEIVRKISSDGLEGLDESDKAKIPDVDLNDKSHRAFFESSEGTPEARERQYETQAFTDEYIADTIATRLSSESRPSHMVVLVRDERVISDIAVPKRAALRGVQSHRVVLAITQSEVLEQQQRAVDDRDADYFWVLEDED